MVCRFFPIKIPASKHRGSTESSILLVGINLPCQRGVFIPNKFGLAEGRSNAALLLFGS
jgi:hypothetical protein